MRPTDEADYALKVVIKTSEDKYNKMIEELREFSSMHTATRKKLEYFIQS